MIKAEGNMTIHAVYENGVFRPSEKVDLPDPCEVEVEVRQCPNASTTHWPAGFFEAIRIEDPAFARPIQGPIPPAPLFD
jgi:predicted DNA-binding antitoxin AbrB/MazE fold protein